MSDDVPFIVGQDHRDGRVVLNDLGEKAQVRIVFGKKDFLHGLGPELDFSFLFIAQFSQERLGVQQRGKPDDGSKGDDGNFPPNFTCIYIAVHDY